MVASAILQALMSAPDQHLIDIGTRLALIGMGTVFIGLVILSLSLPLIRKIAEGKSSKKTTSDSDSVPPELTKDEIVAVTTAIHMHYLKTSHMEDMKLTWEMYERPYSPWRLAGRSKLLLDRAAFRQRNRSR